MATHHSHDYDVPVYDHPLLPQAISDIYFRKPEWVELKFLSGQIVLHSVRAGPEEWPNWSRIRTERDFWDYQFGYSTVADEMQWMRNDIRKIRGNYFLLVDDDGQEVDPRQPLWHIAGQTLQIVLYRHYPLHPSETFKQAWPFEREFCTD